MSKAVTLQPYKEDTLREYHNDLIDVYALLCPFLARLRFIQYFVGQRFFVALHSH